MLACWLVFIGLSLYHRHEVSRKNRAGEQWFSFSMGSSILPVPCSEEVIYKWVEPGVTLLAGIILYPVALVVAIWLVVSAFALLIHNHLAYYYQRQAFLDARDAQIQSRYMNEALSGKPARQTAGFVIAESNVQMVRKDASLKDAFASLSSDLKGVMTAA